MRVDVRRIPADSDDALALVAAMVAGLQEIYGEQPGDAPTATVEDLNPPGGGFIGSTRRARPSPAAGSNGSVKGSVRSSACT